MEGRWKSLSLFFLSSLVFCFAFALLSISYTFTEIFRGIFPMFLQRFTYPWAGVTCHTSAALHGGEA